MSNELIPFEQGSRPPAGVDTPTAPTTFDYSELPDDLADELRQSADRIRGWGTDLVDSVFKIGQELIVRKRNMPRGKWGSWLATFDYDERTAQRYMRAFETLGEKSDTVSGLGATAIYALSARSTPKKTRNDIVDRLERGERLTSQMVLQQVTAARQKPRAIAASSTLEERKVDAAPERQSSRQGRPDQDQPADAVASARRAADLILEQLRQDREKLAFLVKQADDHELVERLRQGLGVRSGQAAMAEALPVAHQSPSRKQGDQEGLTES